MKIKTFYFLPIFLLTFLLTFLMMLEGIVFADNTRVTNPSAVILELGGRGMIYSFVFERVLSEQLAAGVGLGSVTTNTTNGVAANQSSVVIPVYATFYFAKEAGSLFLTAGASVLSNSVGINGYTSSMGNLQFSSSPFVLNAGLGYEYRADAGYLVRLTAYGLFAQNFAPWGGISFGYSF